MSVGSKIRHIRILRGLTQKELGLKAGFSATTADVRIRQYESNKMIPKANKLKDIADALDVDLSALSNISFSSQNELIHTLFDLERDHGLCITKQDNQYYLHFDEEHPDGLSLKHALDAWYNARQHFLSDNDDENYTNKNAYEIWKQRYPLDLQETEKSYDTQVYKFFAEKSIQLKTQSEKPTRVNDFLLLFEKMIKSGIDMDIISVQHQNSVGMLVTCVSFKHSVLLALKEHAYNSFAEFLCLTDNLKSIGMNIEQFSHSFENQTYMDFYFHSSVISTLLLESVRPMKEAIIAGTFEEDIHKMEFEKDMKLFNIPIEHAL